MGRRQSVRSALRRREALRQRKWSRARAVGVPLGDRQGPGCPNENEDRKRASGEAPFSRNWLRHAPEKETKRRPRSEVPVCATRILRLHKRKWGPALLPAPTAPSEGYAGVRNLVKNPKAPTRSRSWLTSSGVASYRTTPSEEEPDRSTRLRGPKVRWSFDRSGLASRNRSLSKPKPSDALRPFLGRPLSRPASLLDDPETASKPRRAGGRSTLPAPLPGWPRTKPESSIHCLPAEIGPLVTCRSLLVLADLPRRPGPPSRSHEHHARLSRVAKAKNGVRSLWITGISGTTVGTFSRPLFDAPLQLPFRSPQPTSAKCLNRLHHRTSPPIFTG